MQTNESLEGSVVLEGVSIDSHMEGLSKEESALWADDRLTIQWIMQFTDGGQEGNGFQTELNVSNVTCSFNSIQSPACTERLRRMHAARVCVRVSLFVCYFMSDSV